MTTSVLTSTTLLLGTAWTGTAPGTSSTPSGTINSGSGTYIDLTTTATDAAADFARAMQDGTTFGSGGYQTMLAGLQSGTLNITVFSDFASGANMEKLFAIYQAGFVYFDLKPTSASRGPSNPSAVGQACANSLSWAKVKAGDIPALQLSWPLSGAYTVLTS